MLQEQKLREPYLRKKIFTPIAYLLRDTKKLQSAKICSNWISCNMKKYQLLFNVIIAYYATKRFNQLNFVGNFI